MEYHDTAWARSGRRELREEDRPTPYLEISAINPAASRVRGGIWNEHILPVMEWEAAEHRVVLPIHLQLSLGLEAPVLRWDRQKYERVIREHARDLPVIRDISRYLNDWQYHGNETGYHPENRRILFQDESGRWYAASIGSLHDSENIITVFSGSKTEFRTNRLKTLENVVRREK